MFWSGGEIKKSTNSFSFQIKYSCWSFLLFKNETEVWLCFNYICTENLKRFNNIFSSHQEKRNLWEYKLFPIALMLYIFSNNIKKYFIYQYQNFKPTTNHLAFIQVKSFKMLGKRISKLFSWIKNGGHLYFFFHKTYCNIHTYKRKRIFSFNSFMHSKIVIVNFFVHPV